jgi:hypothetical protein
MAGLMPEASASGAAAPEAAAPLCLENEKHDEADDERAEHNDGRAVEGRGKPRLPG